MENKINVAGLLKGCPKGMKLDCTMFDNLELDSIVNDSILPIRCRVKRPDGGYHVYNLTKYGCWLDTPFSKCVIFPKGKTTWEGFHKPFEDGDILATNDGKFIAIIKKNGGKYYCCCHTNGNYFITDYSGWFDRLATEEEKEKLFNIIKANGYRWNDKTKKLEEFIEPKFKVGDKVKIKNVVSEPRIIDGVFDTFYSLQTFGRIEFTDQDKWELVSNESDKSDIIPFKPFDKVLVRDDKNHLWKVDFYSHFDNDTAYKYVCVGDAYIQCIPYNEETTDLIGTNFNCPDKYKIWKDE